MAHTERAVQYKLFTPEEANACLPLVRAIAEDMSRLCREVVDRRQRLSFLRERQPRGGADPYQEELSQVEEDLQRDMAQLQEYVDELRQLGVEPKSALEGLIDFPAMLDGRLVYLCWKLGEPGVLYWHELEAGYQGRHPFSERAASVASHA
jgi:hypothetical protein